MPPPRRVPPRLRGRAADALAAILADMAGNAADRVTELLNGSLTIFQVCVADPAHQARLADALHTVAAREAGAHVVVKQWTPPPISEIRSRARIYAEDQAAALVENITTDTQRSLRQVLVDTIGRVQGRSVVGAPSWPIPVSGPRFAPGDSWRSEGMTRALTTRIKALVGQTDRQAAAIQRYGDDLQTELVTGKRTHPRGLERDRGAGRKIVTTQDEVDRLVQVYADRSLIYRAETIAGTETHAALMNGRQAAWSDAYQRGDLGPLTMRMWMVDQSDRTCEHCASLEGELTPLMGGKWEDDRGTLAETPPLHARCRCWMDVVEVARFSPPSAEHPPGLTSVE